MCLVLSIQNSVILASMFLRVSTPQLQVGKITDERSIVSISYMA